MLSLSVAPVSAEPVAATQATQPATAPAEWGKPKAGLQTSLAPAGPARVGEGLSFTLRLRNIGTAPVTLGPGKDVFGWLLVAQGQTRYYSQRVHCAQGAADWPEKLEGGKEVVLAAIDLSKAKAYAYADREELLKGYLSRAADEKLPASAGMLTKRLADGDAKAVWALYLPGEGGNSLVVQSNLVEFPVQSAGPAPPAGSLTAKFHKDEYSARDAHNEAVAQGPSAVPELIAVANDRKAPYFARMWAATALADISDERAVAALVELVNSPSVDVRNVVAYHGPKRHSAELDRAILARALNGDLTVTVWAAQGFSRAGTAVPETLRKAAIEAKKILAQVAEAEAMAGRTDAESLTTLLGLLADDREQVRGAAATAIEKRTLAPSDRARVLETLVAALDAPGEQARQRICRVLSKLTGQSIPYDPAADEPKRQQALKAWRNWWTEQNRI